MEFTTQLGNYQATADQYVAALAKQNIIQRIWDHDHTVWQDDPEEITNRLGWLHSPNDMQTQLDEINELVTAVQAEGYTDVLLLGMGGSSLAPELFSLTFGPESDGLHLEVLDSTHPAAVAAYDERLDPAKTLFIVATKSGGTVETLSGFKYFYNQTAVAVGADQAGAHFVAITDPGSKLVDLATRYNFRKTFLNDPNIGGRYSVLSHFGLVPAALVGVDVAQLLDNAIAMATERYTAALLGAVLGGLALEGRDKVTFVLSDQLASFGDWAEQLIAESMGKSGKGILPVVGEALGTAADYGDDRLFVQLHLEGDASADVQLAELTAAGYPLVRITLNDLYDLGGQFLLWELATAVAGHILQIHPFNQPNVESAKVAAREMVKAYHETGSIPQGETSPLTAETLNEFLAQANAGDYISLQAYVPQTAENLAAYRALQTTLRDQTKLAVTFGFGPRFLHSTGQLHKGDAGNGLFIQFLDDAQPEIAIPDEAGDEASAMSFGVLIQAQAMGDAQALKDADRRLIRFDVDGDVAAAIQALA